MVAPENRPSEYESSIPTSHFLGAMSVSERVGVFEKKYLLQVHHSGYPFVNFSRFFPGCSDLLKIDPFE